MNRCSYCQKQVIRNLKISEILGLGKILPQICEDCSNLFRPINKQQSCRTCQKELPGDIMYCEDCIAWKNDYPNYDFSHHACFYYDSAFKEWLKRYKFMGDVRLAGTFAKQLQIIQQEFSDYQICPIPLATARLKERGFNQVIEMLRVAKIPYSQLLTRSDHSLPQSQKTRQERLKTTQPFKLAVVPTIIKGKKVLLVDDVYTTGQTLFHAASCLLPHAPEKIRTFSLAR